MGVTAVYIILIHFKNVKKTSSAQVINQFYLFFLEQVEV
jgi:hypothetical protein